MSGVRVPPVTPKIKMMKKYRPDLSLRHEWSPKSRAEVLRRVNDGETMAGIARELGLSRNRISQVVSQAKQEAASSVSRCGLHGLSNRAKNSLKGAGLMSREEVAKVVSCGDIKRIQNLGRVCQAEVLLWLQQAGTDPDAG